jgi:undecaprenyl diphosphate synthase
MPSSIAQLESAGEAAPPVHVAIIMDGNGRWARSRGLPRTEGHRRGAESVRRTAQAAVEQGVRYLTLFAFSSENWRRPADEVEDLMGLLRLYLRREVAELHREGVRIRVIGERAGLAPDIQRMIDDAETRTRDNARLTMTVALNYGSRGEITRAARRLAERVRQGELEPEEIDEAALDAELYTHGLPDPDLLIRTSGEQRVSNFLLWQLAYTEFVFTDVYWPDFSKEDFANAVRVFQGRERRYGATFA